MFGNRTIDTLVVGAGPIGMMAGLSLARIGIETAVVDSAIRSSTSRHALLLHPATLQQIDRLGFVESILNAGYRVDRTLVYDDAQPREVAHLNELAVSFPYAVAITQSDLESILEDELHRLHVPVLWNHQVGNVTEESHGVKVDIDCASEKHHSSPFLGSSRAFTKSLHYKARLLIAADGYNSRLRRLLHSEPKQLGPAQYYAFFEFDTDADPRHALRLSLQEELATAQYPLCGGHARLSFQYSGLTLPPEFRNKNRLLLQNRYERPQSLDKGHLSELVEKRVPWSTGSISRVKPGFIVPFEQKYLTEPFCGSTFFLGDAARSFEALNMTSVNFGLQEAEQIALCYGSADDDEDARRQLGSLARRTVAKWEAIADIANRATPIAMADPWTAQNRARILRALPCTGNALERLASQFFIHLDLKENITT